MGPLPPKFITIIVVVFLVFFAVASHSEKLKTFTRNYDPFKISDSNSLNVLSPATIGTDALVLTPEVDNPGISNTTNKSGRVLLRQPFKLFLTNKSKSSSRIASFNSSFLINISPIGNNTSKGEGLAFIVVPNPDVPVDSYGEYLGLTNSSMNGNWNSGKWGQ